MRAAVWALAGAGFSARGGKGRSGGCAALAAGATGAGAWPAGCQGRKGERAVPERLTL
jgi:hypothetical protein